MEIKKVELKAIKFYKNSSQETLCYSGKVYVNGKFAVEVGNAGFGGCDEQRPNRKFKGHETIVEELDSYFRRTEKAWMGFNGAIFCDLEMWCGRQIVKNDIRKSLKRNLKKEVYFYKKDEKNLYSIPIKKNPKQVVIMHVKNKYPKAKILNEMDIEVAVNLQMENSESDNEFYPTFDKLGNCTNLPENKKVINNTK